jgi:transposase
MSKSYTKEFKQETVRLVETSGKPKAEIAHDLGISESALYRWLKKYGQQPTVAEQSQSVEELKGELKRVKRENEILRQERDVLKRLSASAAQAPGELSDDRSQSGPVCSRGDVPSVGRSGQWLLCLAQSASEPT